MAVKLSFLSSFLIFGQRSRTSGWSIFLRATICGFSGRFGSNKPNSVLVWALGIFNPTISGLIVSGIIGGWSEVKRLLAGITRWKVGLRWYFWAAFLLLGPMVIALVYVALAHPAAGLKLQLNITLR